MDNASKALIMAGAILISVAIVGIGIYIFTTANALTDDAVGQIDSLAVDSVNSRIYTYCGQNVRGSAVIQLIREINTLNAQGALPDTVTINGSVNNDTKESEITQNARYTVDATTNPTTGYIDIVTITEK